MLIVVENLSVPFDRRVWRECQALTQAGYSVSVICPKGMGRDTGPYEEVFGVSIYRYDMPHSDGGFIGYIREYTVALIMTMYLMIVILARERYDVIQLCLVNAGYIVIIVLHVRSVKLHFCKIGLG